MVTRQPRVSGQKCCWRRRSDVLRSDRDLSRAPGGPRPRVWSESAGPARPTALGPRGPGQSAPAPGCVWGTPGQSWVLVPRPPCGCPLLVSRSSQGPPTPGLTQQAAFPAPWQHGLHPPALCPPLSPSRPSVAGHGASLPVAARAVQLPESHCPGRADAAWRP